MNEYPELMDATHCTKTRYFYRRCFDSCVWPNKSIMIRFRPPAFLVFEYNGLHSVWKSPLKKYHFATLHLLMQIVIFGAKIQSFEKRVCFFKMRHFWWFSNKVCYQPCFCISFLPFSIIDFYESLLDIFLFLHNKETGEETQNFYKTLCPVPLLLYIRT